MGKYIITASLVSELKNLGYTFKTQTDTEVILAAFAAWGTTAFNKMNGMFAFALFDNQNAKLYLVRDPSGIKPLYYAETKEGLAFASEIRGFKAVPYLKEENNLWPVYLMAYGHLPEPVTTLKHARPVPKGSFLCYHVKDRTSAVQSYKKFQFDPRIFDRECAISCIKNDLQRSVKRHLIADAPIGVFLSGGLDSGIISLLASADQQTKLNTLSLFFEEHEFQKKIPGYLVANVLCQQSVSFKRRGFP